MLKGRKFVAPFSSLVVMKTGGVDGEMDDYLFSVGSCLGLRSVRYCFFASSTLCPCEWVLQLAGGDEKTVEEHTTSMVLLRFASSRAVGG